MAFIYECAKLWMQLRKLPCMHLNTKHFIKCFIIAVVIDVKEKGYTVQQRIHVVWIYDVHVAVRIV